MDFDKLAARLEQLRREYADAMLMKNPETGADAGHQLGLIQGHYRGITAALNEINQLIDEENQREQQL